MRGFLASPAPGALLDLPWAPFFVGVIFIFHSLLGWLAFAGAVALVALALANRRATRTALERAARLSADAAYRAEEAHREMETARGMGMIAPLRARWKAVGASTR